MRRCVEFCRGLSRSVSSTLSSAVGESVEPGKSHIKYIICYVKVAM